MTENNPTPYTIRQGTPDDAYTTFVIFEQTLADLVKRFGSKERTSASDPAALADMWRQRRSLYEFLSNEAAQFWIAEQDGEAIGFSRSVLTDGMLELTELFVKPGIQSRGLGGELINRAFSSVTDTRFRSIIATTDFRAQSLYLKNGVVPRFPIYYFGRKPEFVRVETELNFEPMTASDETLELLAAVDQQIIHFRRDAMHRWLLADRDGFLCLHGDIVMGYGYMGNTNGPFALLDPFDFPAVLAHAEGAAARAGRDHFGVEVPIPNQTAVDYLRGRQFKIDSFMAVFMSDESFGRFENYILTSPPFFL